MPHLVEVQERYGSDAFSLLAVTEVPAPEAEAFVLAEGLTFPVLAGGPENVAAYGIDLIWGSPVFLVEPGGQIVADDLAGAEAALSQAFPGE